jgi:DNA-binding FadR family transcriptional regulator
MDSPLKTGLATSEDGAASLSTAERVAGELRRRIAYGGYEIGDALPAEHQLMESFGVSRPTCREALRILQSEGLISIQRGNRGGARVTMPDAAQVASYASVFLQLRGATITEVFNTRAVIEPAAVALLAQCSSPPVLSMLAQNVAAQLYLLDDRPAFYRKGREFRAMLLDHCGSESLRLMGLMIGEIADQQLSMLSECLPTDDSVEDHRYAVGLKQALIEALAARESTRAADLWRQYLHFYLDILHRKTPPELRNMKPFPL